MSELRFDGQVAVVTGGGRGIGAGYATLLASRGAQVVVNDIGGSMDGSGSDQTPAMQTAQAIQDAGGIATWDRSDISTPDGAQALIDRAISSFGRLDIVVNNAGIYWIDEFPDVDVTQLEKQLSVHVGGSFNVTRAAWPHLRSSGSGRVVMTISTGALGAAQLTSYGTAKSGVWGLGRALAMVGVPDGIKVNMVAPMGMSRMMVNASDVPNDPDRDPKLVAPLVALLCHRDCSVSGESYVSGMRRVTRLLISETEGYLHPSHDLAPEDLLDRWDQINDVSKQHLVPDTASWSALNNQFIGLTPRS